MKHNSSSFKWRHYPPEVILLCVRWYCRFQLSYRDVEEMMRERGLDVDHSTVFRWVQRYAPEINKRIRQHLKMSGISYRVDETYIKVGKTCKYLYRAVDKEGQTIESVAAWTTLPINLVEESKSERLEGGHARIRQLKEAQEA